MSPRRPAPGPGHRMQVDVVRHLAVRAVHQVKLDFVTMADPDKLAGHAAAKGPERVVHSIGHALHQFHDFELDSDFRWMIAGDGWWNIRRIGEHRVVFLGHQKGADVETNLRHPRMMVGSDGIVDLTGRPHPRPRRSPRPVPIARPHDAATVPLSRSRLLFAPNGQAALHEQGLGLVDRNPHRAG